MEKFIRRIKNGAQILAESKAHPLYHTVLCRSTAGEYVTWRLDENDNAYLGHYHSSDLDGAIRDFINRGFGIREHPGIVREDATIPALGKHQAD